MSLLPYDIIFKIYFYISDYDTILNYYTLNKHFYNKYVKYYKMINKHRFKTISNDISSFLHVLPSHDIHDIYFLIYLNCIGVDSTNHFIIYNDYVLVYNTIFNNKNFFIFI